MENELNVVNVRLVPGQSLLSEKPLTSPEAVVGVMSKELAQYDREVFCILNMNSQAQVINMNIVSVGGLNAAYINIREVFKSSILSNAAGVIALHNHPSGSIRPSLEDCLLTKKIQQSGELLDIELWDHIIIGGGNGHMLSLREQGVLTMSAERMYAHIVGSGSIKENGGSYMNQEWIDTGKVIQELRTSKQLTQEEFASSVLLAIDELKQIEKGSIPVAEDTLLLIGNLYRVYPEELRQGTLIELGSRNQLLEMVQEIQENLESIREDNAYFRSFIEKWELDQVHKENKEYVVKPNLERESKQPHQEEVMFVIEDTYTRNHISDLDGSVKEWATHEAAQAAADVLNGKEQLEHPESMGVDQDKDKKDREAMLLRTKEERAKEQGFNDSEIVEITEIMRSK